jgi:hypothetical protein
MTDAAGNAADTDAGAPSFDVAQVMGEIEEEARQRRASGDLPIARERELNELFLAHAPASGAGGDLTEALQRVDLAMFVDPVVPIDSNRKAGAVVKKGMRSASLWYVGWLTRQVNQFASATSRSLHMIERHLTELERTVAVQRVPAAEVVDFPALHGPEAWWIGPAVAAVVDDAGPDDDRPRGRILHAACGDGWLVRLIDAAGGDAYGVDPRPGRAEPGPSGTADLRQDGVAAHLTTVAPDALGAVVLSGVVDGMAGGERSALLELITSRLAHHGVLVVHVVGQTVWQAADAPVQADLAPGRPLRPDSWRHLLDESGYDVTVQPGPDGADFLVVAVRRGVTPAELFPPPA